LYGYRLDPSGNFGPNYGPPGQCCWSNFLPTDQFPGTDQYQSVAQDSAGFLWVYDVTTNAIVQFSQSSTSGPAPTGVSIATTGLNIGGLAGDANGFLYGVDTANNHLLVWQVVGGAPTLKDTITDAGAASVSVVPNVAALPTPLPGAVLVADTAGATFYTNASAGTPTLIATAPDPAGAFGLVSAAISPDAATIWTIDTNYTVALSGVKAANNITMLASGDPEDDLGNIAPSIGGYVYTTQGPDIGLTTDVLYMSGGNIYRSFSLETPSTTGAWGVCISP
jgi:hypothetical protein